MKINYTSIAGQNVERLAALNDGIFAVGMTLLVLDLHVPIAAQVIPDLSLPQGQREQLLWAALINLAPSLVPYFMSFLTLGIFWVGQQAQLNYFARSDRNLTWLNLAFLLAVSIMPFSTALLSAFITYQLALLIYWLNIFALGILLYLSIRYAERAGLLAAEATDAVRQATKQRIVNYQILYLIGALLCVINTYVSIGFIVLTQLNAAFALGSQLERRIRHR